MRNLELQNLEKQGPELQVAFGLGHRLLRRKVQGSRRREVLERGRNPRRHPAECSSRRRRAAAIPRAGRGRSSARELIDFAPELVEIEFEAFAARLRNNPFGGAERCGVATRRCRGRRTANAESVALSSKTSKVRSFGIDNPIELHAERGVLGALLDSIAPRVLRSAGDDLDHDVGRIVNEVGRGRAPAGQVRVDVRLRPRVRLTANRVSDAPTTPPRGTNQLRST